MLWRPSQETAITRRLPKKVQVWQSYELKQAMKTLGLMIRANVSASAFNVVHILSGNTVIVMMQLTET